MAVSYPVVLKDGKLSDLPQQNKYVKDMYIGCHKSVYWWNGSGNVSTNETSEAAAEHKSDQRQLEETLPRYTDKR